jgi:phage terminase large subunit
VSSSTLKIKTAKVFKPLLAPSRYKGGWGGRGSGKSHFFAEAMVEAHYQNRGETSVCIREIQKSIAKSSKALIEYKIKSLGLGESDGFKAFNDVIQTPGDGAIIFQGMQDHTSGSLKSLFGMRRAWVEEAQTLSSTSLQLLKPTIREDGSELWFSWNARRKTDPVDAMFRGDEIPTGAAIVKANYSDNPWFPDVLEQERLDDLRINPDQYPHIWEGEYLSVMVGAYFARQLTTATAQNRMTRVHIDPLMTIYAYWDIGGTGAKADACAIWICQFIGMDIRVIDYYESIGQDLSTHLNWLRANGYESALCVLPHDGAQHSRMESVTYEGAVKKGGFTTRVIPNQGTGAALQRIEAVRRLFPAMYFDKDRCEAGIEALGWYHEKRDEARNIGLGPSHDWASHGADSFGMMCISYEQIQLEKQKNKKKYTRSAYTPQDSVIGY